MESIVSTLACCLLVLSFALAQTGNEPSTITSPTATLSLNFTHLTTMPNSSHSTIHATGDSNSIEGTTQSTSTSLPQVTITDNIATTTEKTSNSETTQSYSETTQSSTTPSPLTSTTTLKSATTSSQLSTLTVMTTEEKQTTVNNTGTPTSQVTKTEYSTHTVTTTLNPVSKTNKGEGLNISERSMTIAFSVILGMIVVALIVFTFHKYKHKIQYIHQPLTNADDTGAFVADGDTLVISGGLYDGHPIYDNVPPPPADESQFRLEFLH